MNLWGTYGQNEFCKVCSRSCESPSLLIQHLVRKHTEDLGKVSFSNKTKEGFYFKFEKEDHYRYHQYSRKDMKIPLDFYMMYKTEEATLDYKWFKHNFGQTCSFCSIDEVFFFKDKNVELLKHFKEVHNVSLKNTTILELALLFEGPNKKFLSK